MQPVENRNLSIMIAAFNGNPSNTMISCYSPTNISSEDDVEGFCGTLSGLVKYIPKYVCIIGLELDAEIGKEDAKASAYHNNTNINGQQLLKLQRECNMMNKSTNYIKKRMIAVFYISEW